MMTTEFRTGRNHGIYRFMTERLKRESSVASQKPGRKICQAFLCVGIIRIYRLNANTPSSSLQLQSILESIAHRFADHAIDIEGRIEDDGL